MLRSYYRDLQIYRYAAGDFDTQAGYVLNSTFKGIIQAPKNSKQFNNGKDGQKVDAILFCDIGQGFQPKDKIKDPISGQAYFLSGYNSQPLGVCGLTPNSNQHAEHSLTYDGEFNG